MSSKHTGRDAAIEHFRNTLIALGVHPEEGAGADIAGTPRRWVDAFLEMTAGYTTNAAEFLAVRFPHTGRDMVALTGIPFVSLCEHHLLPFTGTAAVAYLPDGNAVVGLSKLARVVDVYAKRLQLQERLGAQIADAIFAVYPLGCAVVIRAQHSCMACRGVSKPGATMVTSTLRGVFRSDAAARAEVLGILMEVPR